MYFYPTVDTQVKAQASRTLQTTHSSLAAKTLIRTVFQRSLSLLSRGTVQRRGGTPAVPSSP